MNRPFLAQRPSSPQHGSPGRAARSLSRPTSAVQLPALRSPRSPKTPKTPLVLSKDPWALPDDNAAMKGSMRRSMSAGGVRRPVDRNNHGGDRSQLARNWHANHSCGSPARFCRDRSGAVQSISVAEILGRRRKNENQDPRKQAKMDLIHNDWIKQVLASQTKSSKKKDTPAREESVSTKASSQDATSRNTSPRDFVAVLGCCSYPDVLDRLRSSLLDDDELKRATQAYKRFAGDQDLDKELVESVLSHLGWIVSDDAIDEQVEKVTDMTVLDKQDVMSFLEEYVQIETQLIKAEFDREVGLEKTISSEQLLEALRSLNMMVLQSTLDDLQGRARLEGAVLFEFDEMIRIVAAYRACEGFTLKELADAQEAYDAAVDGKSVNVEDLPNALIDFFGVHCIRQLREMIESAGQAFKNTGQFTLTISYAEFLIWARRLRTRETFSQWQSFQSVDDDSDGRISFEQLKSMMKMEGFTLSDVENEEVLRATNLDDKRDGSFSFDDSHKYLMSCRECEGFSHRDHEELTAVYKKFDPEDAGEISTGQVLDLLRYLGYQVNIEEVDGYAKQVDFNGNGTMDAGEYFRLMRLHREQQLSLAHAVFVRRIASRGGQVSMVCVSKALQELKCRPSSSDEFNALCERALGSDTVTSGNGMSFDAFMSLADEGRKEVRNENRKRANFQEAEFKLLDDAFKKIDLQGRGWLEEKQVLLLLHNCGLPIQTDEGRRHLLEVIEKARDAARAEEISDQELGGSRKASFLLMLHVWRLIARENEGGYLERMDRARAESRFSKAEIDEFQQIFMSCLRSKKKSSPTEAAEAQPTVSSESSRRKSVPDLRQGSKQRSQPAGADDEPSEPPLTLESILGLDQSKDQLSFGGLKRLLNSLTVKLAPKMAFTLQEKVSEITGKDQCSIDFPDFLRLMRWMIDTDFAGINEVTAQVVKSYKGSISSLLSTSQPAAQHKSPAATPRKPSRSTARRQSV